MIFLCEQQYCQKLYSFINHSQNLVFGNTWQDIDLRRETTARFQNSLRAFQVVFTQITERFS